MATKHVVKIVTDALTQVPGGNVQRPERVYESFGTIPAASYAVGDTIVFDHIDLKELINARFVTAGAELEIMHGTSTAAPITWDLATGTTEEINYYISYVKGGEQAPIQLTVISTP